METKNFGLELKDLTDEGVIEGYASVFGNVDRGGDKVMPGAFVDGLVEARRTGRKIKMLWQHDPGKPIGVWDDLAEDAKGLWGKGRLVLDVPLARETLALMKAGALDALSIGYTTKSSEPDGNYRLLKSVELFEVSPVTFPMNDRAKITSAKSSDPRVDAVIEKIRAGERPMEREFELLLKGAFDFSNSQAERAARVLLKGQGDPADADKGRDADEFARILKAMIG